MTDTMTSVRIHDYGGPDAVQVDRVAIPRPNADEVLVRVRAWGVNPVDWKIREGLRRDRLVLEMPVVLGCDLSGVVEAVGADVAGLAPGDEVFAMTGLYGAYSGLVAITADKVAKKPASLDHTVAAAVPLAALTAWQAFELAGMKAGDKVLILAGGGGVGGFAVQIAKALGARVTATASTEKADYVRGLGADTVIDYRKTRFEDVVCDVDVVFDLVGGEEQTRALTVLKPGGFLVTALIAPTDEVLAPRKQKGARVGVVANGAQLQKIAALIDEGRIRVHVEDTYPLARAAEAIERVKAGRTRGKVVLLAQDD